MSGGHDLVFIEISHPLLQSIKPHLSCSPVVPHPPPMMCFQGCHYVEFFSSSSLFSPCSGVKLSCDTFHWWVQLVPANADLYWVLEQCFACGGTGHLVKDCSLTQGPYQHICNLLDDPHGEWSELLSPPSRKLISSPLAWDSQSPNPPIAAPWA